MNAQLTNGFDKASGDDVSVYQAIGKFVNILHAGPSESGTTQIWDVRTKDGMLSLGQIKWFVRWRKYAFFPNHDTVFEEICLGEIAAFIQNVTKFHRQNKKAKKS